MAGIIMAVVLFSSIAFAVEESSFYVDDGKVVIIVPSCKYEENFYSFLLVSRPNLEGMYFEISEIEELSFWDVAFRRLTLNVAAVVCEEEGKEVGIRIHALPIPDGNGNDVHYSLYLVIRPDLGDGVLQLTDWMHENLKYYGVAFTAVDGIGKEGGYIQEVSSFSNIVMIGSDTVSDDIAKIELAAGYGMESIVVVCDIFFEGIWDENGQLIDVVLRSDYTERWLEYVEEIYPFKDKILGFFLFDEMYWVATQCGISFKKMRGMVEEAASAIKAQFPQTKVIGSIAITEGDLEQKFLYGFPIPEDAQEEYGIPEGYDWVAVYNYWAQCETGGDEFFKTWDKRMQSFEKYMHPHQDIILVPGTFYFSFQDSSIEDDLLQLANFYYDMAKTNSRIVAIVPFLWPSFEHLVGMKDMPQLQKPWAKIGKKIINN